MLPKQAIISLHLQTLLSHVQRISDLSEGIRHTQDDATCHPLPCAGFLFNLTHRLSAGESCRRNSEIQV